MNEKLTIPHDIEAEQAVIGSMIYDNVLINDVITILDEKSFYEKKHQEIYSAIIELYEKNKPIDEILLGDQLKSLNQLEDIGGYGYLAELVECVPSSCNIVYYAKIIQEHAVVRDLIKTVNDIGVKSRDPKQNIAELLAEADKKISDLKNKSNKKEYVSLRDGACKAFEGLEERSKTKGQITGLATGFIEDDKMMLGMQPSDLIIVAGRPSMGKTAYALNMIVYAATRTESKGAILIFSLEMSTEQLILRMLAIEGNIELKKLRTGNLDQKDWDNLSYAAERLSPAKIYINDDSIQTPMTMKAISKKLHRQEEHGLSLIVMDYLQLGSSDKKGMPREQEIAELSRSCKGIAKDLNVPFVALSQLNRALENRADKRPKLSDLRESGAIEQDADIIKFLYRDEVYDEDSEKKGMAEVIISKHRNGEIGTYELVFKKAYTKFVNTNKSINEKSITS